MGGAFNSVRQMMGRNGLGGVLDALRSFDEM